MSIAAGIFGLVGEDGTHIGGGIVAPAAVRHDGEFIVAVGEPEVEVAVCVGVVSRQHIELRDADYVSFN